ncbi:MAG: helix-turn-helix transcriptional regulator [Hydrotalea flava]|jgi:DNA-binding CsgD family transcriptional regulator|uniref:helix-turn-helix domain-containing protein n=1 Tax=Hydrotalea sp. AMD TaxID=2501297 RepID=UPI0010253AA7|nr:helix-turn-helix transcriptional regulator [Hydrotalea sp. AMD]NIM34797.1 helix-turn-helix transcriptional regulator [Hydrotalea flava]NIM38848.1 helix-turn-helix transcriptional regulator [Hydrotalea flava]NIN02793.1 helix-turn-helix transcriptional regulator [Hydrotalea flava]NIN14478.1 helix-turn-helix transcriptional regulator [Hydrotalea flava]NIO94774.1 helix-turn-helix transcriptional regulator [Hydrotalea flava]
MNIKMDDFFKPLKLASQPTSKDYKEAELYCNAADAFARTAHQCIYIIDYYKKGFLYVSENPLFLCGQSAKSVLNSGYDFYATHVPADELNMLLEINEAGFKFYNKIPVYEKLKYSISFDFHLIHPNKQLVLINHKLTPLVLDKQHNIWLALCVVTHSTSKTAGNIIIFKQGTSKRFEYDPATKEWAEQKKIKLSAPEKEILTLSIQGYTMDEIAVKLKIVTATVKFHKKNIFRKLRVKNITQAISFAKSYNIFE